PPPDHATSLLDEHLRALEKADLIREAARNPELQYLFRHALTQEAAYHSILLRQRREFHQRVGESLETLFADRLEEYAPVLAHHFHEAGDPRALTYDTLAGDVAYRLFAKTEAIAHYSRALESARLHPDSPASFEHLYLRRGRALEWDGQFDAAVDNYVDMVR